MEPPGKAVDKAILDAIDGAAALHQLRHRGQRLRRWPVDEFLAALERVVAARAGLLSVLLPAAG
jgi:hypothetical protein